MTPQIIFINVHQKIKTMMDDYMYRGAKFTTSKILLQLKINLGRLFLRNRRLGKSFFYLPLSYLKSFDKGAIPVIELSPEIPAKNMDWCAGKNSSGPRDQSPLCSIVSAGPSKHLFTKHLLFHLYVNCLPPLRSSKPLLPASIFG